MPQPSFTPGKPSVEMARFTNRETQQAIFARYLSLAAGHLPRLPALMFFGVGGVGKSWLLRHLQSQLSSLWHGVPSVRIDFTLEGASNLLRDDPLSALAAIREITQDPCPLFDLAYGFLQVHRGIRDQSSLDHPSRRRAMEVSHEVAKGALGLIPGVGTALQSGYSVLQKLYPYIKSKTGMDPLAALLQGHLKLLRELPPEEIEKRLVWWLTQDLKADGILPLRPYHAAQAAIFVDTLEALEPADAPESRIEIRTRWLRDLICELNDRVLFVLAGQNRLAWERIDPDWADSSWLEQHVVNGLSPKDALEFLRRCGFDDAAVQRAMLDACLASDGAYHTLHLGLIADLGWVEREVNRREVTAALFSALPPGDWTALTRRFLKSLAHQSDADWLRKLAFTPEFDEAAARAAHSASPSQAQDSDWRMLQSFSFVLKLQHKAGWWTIHSAMQRSVLEDVASRESDHGREVHAWWREYWDGRTSRPADEHARLAWYHRWRLDERAALEEWKELAETARTSVPADMPLHHRLLSWWQPIRLLEQPHWNETEALAAVSCGVEYGESTLGDRGENLRQAIACFERALEVLTREAYPQDWAATQNNLGLHGRIGRTGIGARICGRQSPATSARWRSERGQRIRRTGRRRRTTWARPGRIGRTGIGARICGRQLPATSAPWRSEPGKRIRRPGRRRRTILTAPRPAWLSFPERSNSFCAPSRLHPPRAIETGLFRKRNKPADNGPTGRDVAIAAVLLAILAIGRRMLLRSMLCLLGEKPQTPDANGRVRRAVVTASAMPLDSITP